MVLPLVAASVPVVVVNPRQVRDFGKVTGKQAKAGSLARGSLSPAQETRSKELG